ncbi:MAG: hypothetical protein PHI37_01155 [Candidatus Gracilibacteria bacterium]|nr:hypothetical protein [Candidatus Gracilibacteria bacterium]
MIKKLIISILVCISLFAFFKINEINYEKHKEIKYNLVKHPENLPNKDIAKATAFGFENMKADFYWLKTIQYIGANAFHSEYKKYLYAILDLVTELNPYFEKPYTIGMLLLPGYEERYENLTKEEQDLHTKQAELIGLKGIENFCDKDKIEKLKNEDNLLKIWKNKQFQDPCLNYKVPYYLAFLYYYYLNDPISSAKYYKIASANTDSIEGAKTMAAIMQGKGGNREKSFFMFLNLTYQIDPENEICSVLSKELENIGYGIFLNKNINLNGKLVRTIEDIRTKTFSGYKVEEVTQDTQCTNYLNKAIRELNLHYIEDANKIYFEKTGKNSINAKELFDKGYIDFLPTDFQQYDDYGIIYIFNEKTGNYDYDMGRY